MLKICRLFYLIKHSTLKKSIAISKSLYLSAFYGRFFYFYAFPKKYDTYTYFQISQLPF